MGLRASAKTHVNLGDNLKDLVFEKINTRINWGKNLTRECVANFVAINAYPLGLLEASFEASPHPHYAHNENPILLVHGILHNHSAFIRLQKELRKLGWHNIFTVNYKTSSGSIHRMAGDIENKVLEILEHTGAQQVDIVAHSLGGLVARHCMCNGEARGKIRKLITLGTPHQGTRRSKLLKLVPGSSLGEDLMENSYFIRNLNKTPLPKHSKVISISSHFDWTSKNINTFHASGYPEQNYQNINYQHLGHTGLLYSPQVLNDIATHLSPTPSESQD